MLKRIETLLNLFLILWLFGLCLTVWKRAAQIRKIERKLKLILKHEQAKRKKTKEAEEKSNGDNDPA